MFGRHILLYTDDNPLLGQVSKRDPIISNVIDFVLCGWPSKVLGNKVVIPFQLREKILVELYENYPGIVRMKALACSYVWWPDIDSEIEMAVKSCKSYQINQAMPAKVVKVQDSQSRSPVFKTIR